MPHAPATDPYVGTTIPGGLTIKRLIGTGAFARVYEGRTPKGEAAAVKILQEKSPEALQLFTREIKIMRALPAHKHRVRTLGDGHTELHQPFLAMEFVDGGTLRDAIRQRGALPTSIACDLMLQLCEAFSDLHSLGVVHRDLKPENVLLTRGNQIKLSDFGLVKDAQGLLQLFEKEDILKGRVFHNRFDQRLVMGTPEYMAPEQFSDPLLDDQDKAQTDTWTDVYALGLVFYQMLAGHKLWQMKGSSASSLDQQRTLTEFIAVRVNPNSVNEIKCPPNVPRELFAIIERSLRHDPKQRHHTASQMAADIKTWMTTGHAADDFDDTATSAVNLKEVAKSLPPGTLPTPVSRSKSNASAVQQQQAPSKMPAMSSGKSGAVPPMQASKSGAVPPMQAGKSGAVPPPMTSGKSGVQKPPPPVVKEPSEFDEATRPVRPEEILAQTGQAARASDGDGFDDLSTKAVDMKEVMKEVDAQRAAAKAKQQSKVAHDVVTAPPAPTPEKPGGKAMVPVVVGVLVLALGAAAFVLSR